MTVLTLVQTGFGFHHVAGEQISEPAWAERHVAHTSGHRGGLSARGF